MPPISQRLRILQTELAVLEAEVSDPSNPQLYADGRDGTIDPGELVRGLADIRGRLERVSKGKEGRGRLVEIVLGDAVPKLAVRSLPDSQKSKDVSETRDIVDIDRRIGKLEKLVGSSSATLDEVRR